MSDSQGATIRCDQVARRHHVVPGLLLKGFTPSGRKGDHLWEFAAGQDRPRRKPPASVGWIQDYYAVDVPGVAPDYVEAFFGRVEGAAGRILQNIARTHALPDRAELADLLLFVALMHIRGPRFRATLGYFESEVAELSLQLAVSSTEAFEAAKARLAADGAERVRDASYERLRAYIHSDEFGVEVANIGEVHTSSAVGILLDTAKILWRRNWCLLVSDGSADFVISDNPSTVVWTDRAPIPGPPGLAHRGTEVTLPLSRRLALVGRYEPVSSSVPANAWIVAELNARTVGNADRYVYASADNFVYLGIGGIVLGAGDWLASCGRLAGR